MTVPEMETMHENDLFNMFSVFSNVVQIPGVIPATFCTADRSFSGVSYLRSTTAQCVRNIALINIEREYANFVVNNDMNRIIDIFGRQNSKDSYFFYSQTVNTRNN